MQDQRGGIIDIKNPLPKEIQPKDIQAQEMNNCFANIGENLANKFSADETSQVNAQSLSEDRKLHIDLNTS